jgi:long-chain acyl-CoA synthetase
LDIATDCTLQDLAIHPQVRDIIQHEIDELNTELAQYETIKKFEIIEEEFTTDNFLTPSLKVKRKLVSEHFKDKIEAMYH